ncbi:major facilitator superfamily domain-containing protein [Naematelia encephala]|uniref:Major facilitator superfamily domain-containing protein n=1 Tax=Naematelia encephala TaxID=71784 RepID=A0A1Y2BB07_9TREE|nr:major facilitator superfamily domain-containing protein [Naematelia encephala]
MFGKKKEDSATAQPVHEQPFVPEEITQRLEAERISLAGHSFWYRFIVNSWTQIILVSVACFCLPGMYNAISGMGGSGQLDPTVGANASVALLSVGAASVIFIAQPMFDILGVRTILLGGWTYALYTGSLLNYNRTHNGAFVIASGAILGIGAAFLWIAQGAIMLSYPLPHQKGRSIALFWVIFNLGGAIGSFISLGINFHRTKSGTVSDATYVAYMVIMLVGWVACIGLLPSHLVRRNDGSRAAPPPEEIGDTSRWWTKFQRVAVREVRHIIALKDEWRIWFMLPMCFAANWFYSYQQNEVNGLAFTLRSRSLNSSLYWAAQMFGGVIIGFLCDMPWLTRPKRALVGWIFVFVTGNVIMGGGLAFENWFEKQGQTHYIDFSDSSLYVGPCFLYIFYGMYDAFWQGYTYWLLGALCNTPKEAARFVAVYKTMQSVGGAVAYRLTANHLAARKQFISNWCVIAICLVVALPTVLYITEPTIQEAMGDFVDEEEDHPGAKRKALAAEKHAELIHTKVVGEHV